MALIRRGKGIKYIGTALAVALTGCSAGHNANAISGSSSLAILPTVRAASIPGAVPNTPTWTTEAPMPTARTGLGVSVVNNIMYAVGGFNGQFLGTVEAYDPSTNLWTTMASMPTPRYDLASRSVGSVLYAIGGSNDQMPYLNTVEAYDPSTDTWTAKASMPTARLGLAAGVVNNIIYAVGGYNGKVLNTVEAYDPSTDTWSTKASMPTARAGLAVCVVNNILYAVGGANDTPPYQLSTVEAYDPSTDTWATKASMHTLRSFLATGVSGVAGKLLFAVGGYTGKHPSLVSNIVEAYNSATNTWSNKLPMPTSREALAVGVVNMVLYAVGGNDRSGAVNTVEAYTP